MTRRTFTRAALAAGVFQNGGRMSAAEPDLREIISPSDLIYDKPAPRSEAGIPIGTGRMGTLVWTTPSQLHLQINRADVYSSNCATNSFIERNQDYCGGCAFVDIACGENAFPDSGFRQHLSVYDGVLRIADRFRFIACPTHDVIAVEAPAAHVRLRMLRLPKVQTRSHVATSQLHISGERIVLT